MDDSYDLQLARNFYYVCLGLGIVFAICYLVLSLMNIPLTEISPKKCSLYSAFGLYCPGCGGTRSLEYFLHGHFIQSFRYHPVVPYAAVYFSCYIASHSLNIFTKGRCKAMRFRPVYFYIMIAIILIQCVIKNALVIFAGIHII